MISLTRHPELDSGSPEMLKRVQYDVVLTKSEQLPPLRPLVCRLSTIAPRIYGRFVVQGGELCYNSGKMGRL